MRKMNLAQSKHDDCSDPGEAYVVHALHLLLLLSLAGLTAPPPARLPQWALQMWYLVVPPCPGLYRDQALQI